MSAEHRVEPVARAICSVKCLRADIFGLPCILSDLTNGPCGATPEQLQLSWIWTAAERAIAAMPKPECDHDWKLVHDWMGDPEVINGTMDCSYKQCRKCGEELALEPGEGSHLPVADDPRF